MDCVGGIKWRYVFFPIRVGFDGLCRWAEWDKVALGVFFSSGWDLMDCEPEGPIDSPLRTHAMLGCLT